MTISSQNKALTAPAVAMRLHALTTDQVKQAITTQPAVGNNSPGLKVALATDASEMSRALGSIAQPRQRIYNPFRY